MICKRSTEGMHARQQACGGGLVGQLAATHGLAPVLVLGRVHSEDGHVHLGDDKEANRADAPGREGPQDEGDEQQGRIAWQGQSGVTNK